MSKNIEPLICTLDRFENGQAVLIFQYSPSCKSELIMPRRYLPKKAKEGDIMHLDFYLEKEAAERQKNIASKILEEILNGE
ncbi:MAG: DUF3006 domain-containing protein [Patescibacteria group bacterium]|nr:DUF3006 domain-containing protein [Patescibacteria group bacterium]